MLKQIIFCVVLFCISLEGTSQAIRFPFKLNTAREISLLSGGLVLAGTGHLLALSRPGLSSNRIQSLNTFDIPSFDRFATELRSSSAGKWSDVTMCASGLLATTTCFIPQEKREYRYMNSNRVLVIGVMGAESILLTDGFTYLAKSIVLRPRPYMYNPNVPITSKGSPEGRFSFFSGHTSFSACATFFTAKVLCASHPEWKFKPAVWACAAILPAITGYLRVKSGNHFPSDVAAGYFTGAMIGFAIPQMHLKRSSKGYGQVATCPYNR